MVIAAFIIALVSLILVLLCISNCANEKETKLEMKDIIGGTRERFMTLESRMAATEKRLPWGDVVDERDFKRVEDSHWELSRAVAELQKKLENKCDS